MTLRTSRTLWHAPPTRTSRLEMNLLRTTCSPLLPSRPAEGSSCSPAPLRASSPPPPQDLEVPEFARSAKRLDHRLIQRNRMDFQRINKVLNQSCPCDRGGKPCLRSFTFSDLCELRFERSSWAPVQEYQARQEALKAAAAADPSICRIHVKGLRCGCRRP